ncbi:MAG: DsbA family protein [Herminiimonas sp.]|nr:DsbA family protein [Herminiimonas sp.]
MGAPIDFYFDFSSPYGYFASTRIDALAEKYGRRVNWHPLALGIVFKAIGGAPLTALPLKGLYSIHDFARSARFHGIDYRYPSNFPIATQIASRAMLWVRTTHGDDMAIGFAHAIFRALFVDDMHVGEPENVACIATALGLDAADVLDGANSEPIRAQFKQAITDAMAHGVFGAPFIIVDGEAFWGFDRFDQIDALLSNGSI